MNNIIPITFDKVNLQDSFFQSLREDYDGFDDWFKRKKSQDALVQYDDDGSVIGFLYLKLEEKIVDDVEPNIVADKILKVGTFKIDAHGTKMGEQFIKIILDYAVDECADVCYVTIFEKHSNLIKLVQQFGFEYHGTKGLGTNKESVYVKQMNVVTGNVNKDFPLINISNVKKYLLGIYPQYHSVMFPDSILNNENKSIITDVSYTNSIHKIYVCSIEQVDRLKYGDVVILYRTKEDGKSAYYSSVVTSICVVEEVKNQNDFLSFDEFYEYASKYSVFDRNELFRWYKKGKCRTIHMTYNAAFNKRIIRRDLIEKVGLDENQYWGFFELTDYQFEMITHLGGVRASLIKNNQL